MISRPLPVICDRCRAEGLAGSDPFEAFGALLDFQPVPRFSKRADGWDEEVQRAYIAALSLTGTDRAACRAVGKSAFGVKQLLDHEGSAGFRAAREEALAMAADERGRRLAEGVRAVASEQAGWRPPAPPWSRARSRLEPPPPASGEATADPAREEARKRELLVTLLHNYRIKLEQERRARLEGKISAADLYARQITYIEAWADLLSGDLFLLLAEWRQGGYGLVDIVQTPLSRLLDEVRRGHMEMCGEPERPPPPAADLLVDHGAFSTEPPEYGTGGTIREINAHLRAFDERYRRDAEAQIAWEAKALAEAAEWRRRVEGDSKPPAPDPDPPGDGEPGR